MGIFLWLNGVTKQPSESPMYDLVLAVASGELRGVEAIAERLRALYGPDLDEH